MRRTGRTCDKVRRKDPYDHDDDGDGAVVVVNATMRTTDGYLFQTQMVKYPRSDLA